MTLLLGGMGMREITGPVEVSIKEKKKIYSGIIKKITMYARVKVLEIEIPLSEKFHVVYYNNSIVYGEKVDKLEKHSFIKLAHKHGITFDQSHPFISTLLPNDSITLPAKSKLFSNLQKKYSPSEIAYISTTLDSFFSHEHLIKVIEKIYFHYRRNGSFIKAFQVNQTLADFSPSYKSAQERMHLQEYNSYYDLYHSVNRSRSILYKKDPLYIETECFKKRNKSSHWTFLKEILLNEGRLLELVCIWLEKADSEKELEAIEEYTKHALTFVPIMEWIITLAHSKINAFKLLPEAKGMMKELIEKGHYEEAALSLLPFINDLPSTYDDLLMKLWLKLDYTFIEAHLNEFIMFIQHFVQMKGLKESELIISQLVEKLFAAHELQVVNDKLADIQKLVPHSIVLQKLSHMIEIKEDPNRMMELGQYFADFKQYDHAIDCFFWEMELQPQDPAPVWQLMKMYQNKGMTKEAAQYQQLFSQLQGNKGIS